MLVMFTEAITGEPIAINPKSVVAVFTAAEGDNKGKTVIGVTNGSVFVSEDFVSAVGTIQGHLND
jgi:hypothetical protein